MIQIIQDPYIPDHSLIHEQHWSGNIRMYQFIQKYFQINRCQFLNYFIHVVNVIIICIIYNEFTLEEFKVQLYSLITNNFYIYTDLYCP